MLKGSRVLLLLPALAVAGGMTPASAVGESVDQIVARHVEARGGAGRWRAIESLKVTGMLTYLSQDSSFTAWRAPGGKYLLESAIAEVPMLTGYDGEIAWRGSDGGAQRLQGAELAMVVRDGELFTPFFDHKERGIQVTLRGETDFEGKRAVALDVRRADGLAETWYLDPATWLEIGRDSPGSHFGGVVPMRTFFDDFREVAGVKMPFRIESQWHVMERVLAAKSIEANVKVDAARFARPRPAGMEPLRSLGGTWKVAGSQAGHPGAPWRNTERTSVIEAMLGGALLQERYTSSGGQEVVRSYSFDRFKRRFRVTEISDATATLDVQEGVFDNQGRLVLSNVETATTMQAGGHSIHARTSVFDIGEDRFRIEREISTDGGQAWTLVAKASYERVKDPAPAPARSPGSGP